jgi:hypothetical protein
MLSQTIDTKAYNIFLATELFADRYNRRLVVSTVFDNGKGRQGRCTLLPLRQDATLEDEMNKAIHYVLGFTPVPTREIAVNLIHSYPGSVDLPLSHATVQLHYVAQIQNPATQNLKHYIRQNPM